MRRLLYAMLIAGTLLTTAGLNLAAADPSPENPQALLRTIECANGQTYDIVVVAAGAAGHIVGTTEVVILTSAAWVETFTDPVGGEVITESFGPFPVGQGQRTGQQQDLVTCTYQFTYEDTVRGSVHRAVTVEVFVAPRGA
jgi:hypothetical protein